MQEKRNSIADAHKLRVCGTNPSIWCSLISCSIISMKRFFQIIAIWGATYLLTSCRLRHWGTKGASGCRPSAVSNFLCHFLNHKWFACISPELNVWPTFKLPRITWCILWEKCLLNCINRFPLFVAIMNHLSVVSLFLQEFMSLISGLNMLWTLNTTSSLQGA